MLGSPFVSSRERTRAPLPCELTLLFLTIVGFQLSNSINTVVAWGHHSIFFSFIEASRTSHLTVTIRLPRTVDCVLTGHRQSSLGVHISYELVHTPPAKYSLPMKKKQIYCACRDSSKTPRPTAVSVVWRRGRDALGSLPCA